MTRQTPQARRQSNARPGACDLCGHLVPSGAGSVSRCVGSSSNCQQHWDNDSGGWHVRCGDAAACTARREARQAEAEMRRTEAVRHR